MSAGHSPPEIHVVAAILRDAEGRVLIAERPGGKPMAGWWEFPGGKLEADEPAVRALQRELKEELGISVEQSHRLLRLTHDYPERRVHLDVWRVNRYAGTPAAREGQRLAWARPKDLKDWKLLPADEPIVRALTLPPLMLVTPESIDADGFLAGLIHSLEAGIDLVQFRAPGISRTEFDMKARAVIAICRTHGVRVVLNDMSEKARDLGADGVHLSQSALRVTPAGHVFPGLLIGISCHSAEELWAALEHAPDYILLGPVQASASHPGLSPMGWENFSALVQECPVPVYAIGGMNYSDLAIAQSHGAHGIAAIRGLWDIARLPQDS